MKKNVKKNRNKNRNKNKKYQSNMNQVKENQVKKNNAEICIYLLAFFVPFIILLVSFAKMEIYPFGSQQVLVYDAWHQYYPFLMELHRKIRNFESIVYSWRMGLGNGFVSVIAYYLASPLNLLLVLCPQSFLKEFFLLSILMKIGFAGLFCAFVLYKKGGRKDYGIVLFSTLYALCSWAVGYYWNIMWLDTFAVFPLVVLGIELLIEEKKYKLYTISLAAAIVVNYYIGLMVCIFTALYFFAYCIIQKNSIKDLFSNLKRIIGFSLLSIMMSSVVLIPTMVTLQSTFKNDNGPTKWEVTRGWIETLEQTFAYVEPTYYSGLPNLYCGVICVIFLFLFYRLPKISRKEKIVYSVLVLFLFVSTNINMINFAWHGFHVPNSLPDRFTFILSFLMVMLAYRAYSGMDELKKLDYLIVCAAGIVYYAVVFVDKMNRYARENDYETFLDTYLFDEIDFQAFLVQNGLIVLAYLIILFLVIWKICPKQIAAILLAVVVGLELIPTVTAGTEAVQSTDRESYPDKYDDVKTLLAELKEADGNDFHRTEFTRDFSLNTSLLYDFNGLTAFTSTANEAITNILENMGISSWKAGIRYYYQDSTPINNLFLNLKYLITRDMDVTNLEYLTKFRKLHGVTVYKNEAYLPIGFMVEKDMSEFHFEGETPFDKQNGLIKAAAGIEENVFEELGVYCTEHTDLNVSEINPGFYYYEQAVTEDTDNSDVQPFGTFKNHYQMPRDGCAYVYVDMPDASANAAVQFNEYSANYNIGRPNIFPAGTYKQGDVFNVSTTVDSGKTGNITVRTAIFNQDVFNRAYELLKDETFHVSSYTSKTMEGTITAKQDGLMYTSIPFEKGWNVYVDGKKADFTSIDRAFIAVPLSGGEHTVKFVYAPAHVYAGICLSAAAVGILALLSVLEKRKAKKYNME